MQCLNLAKEVREQKLREGQEIGKLVLLAEARLGELFNQMPKATTNNPNGNNQFRSISSRREIDLNEHEDEPKEETEEELQPKPKLVVAAEMGFNKNQVAQFQKLADNPDAVQEAIDFAEKNNTIATRTVALQKAKEIEHEKDIQTQIEDLEQRAIEQPEGLFDVIVIDPPWDWGDEGDVNQFGRAKPEYSTMPFDEIKNLPVNKIADDNCRLFLLVQR